MFKIFKCNSRLLQDMVTIFLEGNVDSIANRWRHLINSSTSRLSICLKGSRAQEKQNTAHTVLYNNEWNFDPNNWRNLVLTFGFKDDDTLLIRARVDCRLVWREVAHRKIMTQLVNLSNQIQLRERASYSYRARSLRQQTNSSRKKISFAMKMF